MRENAARLLRCARARALTNTKSQLHRCAVEFNAKPLNRNDEGKGQRLPYVHRHTDTHTYETRRYRFYYYGFAIAIVRLVIIGGSNLP